MTENLAMWYFIFGVITSFIGFYRAFKGKTHNHDLITSLSWFMFWFIYLPTFVIRYVKYKIKGKSL